MRHVGLGTIVPTDVDVGSVRGDATVFRAAVYDLGLVRKTGVVGATVKEVRESIGIGGPGDMDINARGPRCSQDRPYRKGIGQVRT